MTVKELVEFLSHLNPDTEIHISTYSCGTSTSYPYDINRVKMVRGKLVFEAEDN